MLQSAVKLLFACTLFFTTLSFSGCDNKEEVLDVETPNGELEVEQDTETGALDIDAEEE